MARYREDAMRHLALLALLFGCATSPPPVAMPVSNLPFGDPARRDREAPLVLDAITATATGELLTTDVLVSRLAQVRLVFVGESHTSAGIHEAQRRLIEVLLGAKRKVLVGLEMFPYSEQPALDRWNRGELTEEQFLRESHWYKHWGFDWRYYREILLLARQGAQFVGVNAPREVISAVRKKGFDKLTPEESVHLPSKVDTSSDEHRRLFQAFFSDGDTTHAATAMPEAAIESMFQAQCTWDATMAWNAVRALQAESDPSAVMVVLLGSGHVAFGLGAQRQAAAYASLPMATLIPVPLVDEDGKPARARASYADYLWALPPESTLPLYPTIGVSLADRTGIPHPVVTSVSERSLAGLAGVRAEDRIVSFDGAPIADKEAYLLRLATRSWGDRITLVVERAGKNLTLPIPLARIDAGAARSPER
jgi:uncharacterized iron-regulated protein